MRKIEIKLDSIPAVSDIAKKWKKVLSGAPKTIKQNIDLDYYGGLIFTSAILKGMMVVIREQKFLEESEENYAIPHMASRISNRHACIFEITMDKYGDNLEVEVFLIFDESKRQVENILCLNLEHQIFEWVDSIEKVIEFLELSVSVPMLKYYQSLEGGEQTFNAA